MQLIASFHRATLATLAFVGAASLAVAQAGQPKPATTAARPATAKAAKPAPPTTAELMTKGPKDAPVTVVEFADFMCGGCQMISGALRSFMAANPDIKLHFRNFPLEQTCNPGVGSTLHPGACALALGGFCAAEQSLFWPYHDRVFSRGWTRATDTDVIDLAVGAGADRAKFTACLASPATKSKLALDVQAGVEVGVRVTPTLIVNGRKLNDTKEFAQAVEEARAKAAGAGAAKK